MQELIVLRGQSDSGKSSTLKHLANMFLKFNTLFTFTDDNQEREKLSARLSGKNWFVRGSQSVTDIKKVIFDCGDIKIGITSLGDDWASIEEQLQYFNNAGCDICICAAHPTIKMDEKFEAFCNDGKCKIVTSVYKYSLKEKSPHQQRFADQLIACELFSKVTEAIRRCT